VDSATPPTNLARLGAFAAESWATASRGRKERITVRVCCEGCQPKSQRPAATGSSRQGERGVVCRAYKSTLEVASRKGGIGLQCSRCRVRGGSCTLSQDRQKPAKPDGPRNKGGRPSLNRSESEERKEKDRLNALRRARYADKKQKGIAERLAAEEEEEEDDDDDDDDESDDDDEEEEEEEQQQQPQQPPSPQSSRWASPVSVSTRRALSPPLPPPPRSRRRGTRTRSTRGGRARPPPTQPRSAMADWWERMWPVIDEYPLEFGTEPEPDGVEYSGWLDS
jgi:hypothetical protein